MLTNEELDSFITMPNHTALPKGNAMGTPDRQRGRGPRLPQYKILYSLGYSLHIYCSIDSTLWEDIWTQLQYKQYIYKRDLLGALDVAPCFLDTTALY
jgi:hypothetical protein